MWPLMLRSRRVMFQRQTIRINYTWVLVVALYVLLEMPILTQWSPTRAGPLWHWLAWIVILGLPAVSALLLHRAGKLGRRA